MKKRKQQSFEYGAVILLVSTLLSKVIGALFKIPLERVIGDLGFGYFSSAYDLFTPIYGLSMAGLPIAISRMVAEYAAENRYRDVRAVFSLGKKAFLVTGIIGLVSMLALIYPFVLMTDKTGGSVFSLITIAPSILFCCVMSAYRGYFEGLRNMYPTAVSDIIEAASKLVFGYSIAYIIMLLGGSPALGAMGAILGITLGTVFGALFLWLRYRIKGDQITKEELASSPEPESRKVMFRALIAIAIPVVLSSLASNVASLIDVSMVKWQLNRIAETHADVIRQMYASSIADYNAASDTVLTNAELPTYLYGIRGKAFTIYNLVPTVSSVLGVSALPVLASVWTTDRGNKKEIKLNIDSIMKLTAIIAMPAGIGMAVLSNAIMGLLYKSSASVQIGAPMLCVFGIAAVFAGLTAPLTSMLQAIGKQNVPIFNIAGGAIVKIIVNWFLVGIPRINVLGAPIGTLCCFVFIFFANLFCLIRFSGVVPSFWQTLIKPLLSACLCGAAAFFVSRLPLGETLSALLAIAAAAVVYFAALLALKTFTERDILAFPKGEKLLKIFKKFKIIG